MSKQEFLEQLRKSLSGFPKGEVEERLSFYEEMIDDRIEEGLSEEEAIAAVGPVNTIVLQAVEETPLKTLVKERVIPKRRLAVWEIILLVLGSPIWLSLIIAGAAVLFSLYAVLWSLVITFWAVFVSFVAGAFSGIAAGIFLCARGDVTQGLLFVCAGLVLCGLSIYTFYLCKAATKGLVGCSAKLAIGVKNLFRRKGEA